LRRSLDRVPRRREDAGSLRVTVSIGKKSSPDVQIVHFPETKVAALEHRGSPQREHETVRKLIAWRQASSRSPERPRAYGVHYSDPRTTPPADYRADFCLAVDEDIPPNPQGVVPKILPGGRCARVRHLGSREFISAAAFLYEVWFPASGETLRDFPMFFHYVNVGPEVTEAEMVTDVYLPLE